MIYAIKLFAITHLRAGVLVSFLLSFILKAEQIVAENIGIGDQIPLLQAATTLLNELVLRQRASINTPEIAREDATRDKFLRLVFNETRAKMKSPKDETRDHAEQLWQAIKPYTKMTATQMPEESAAITTLCDLLAGEYATLVAALQLTGTVADLAAANTAFIALYNARTAEMAAHEPLTELKTKEQMKVCIDLYKETVRRFNAYQEILPSSFGVDFANYVNAEIEHYKTYAVHRRHSGDEPVTGDE
jgi:hypothetical protein